MSPTHSKGLDSISDFNSDGMCPSNFCFVPDMTTYKVSFQMSLYNGIEVWHAGDEALNGDLLGELHHGRVPDERVDGLAEVIHVLDLAHRPCVLHDQVVQERQHGLRTLL